MHESYRTFTLQTLRTGPLAIAEKIAEHKDLLEEAETKIKHSIDKLVLFWSMGMSIFCGVVFGILFNSIYIGMILFVALTAAALFVIRIPFIKEKLKTSERYTKYAKQIVQSKTAITELHEKARAYQKHLEISGGPGFLAVYSDILLHEYYPSFFPLEDRIRNVDLSTRGRGNEIDIFDYGRLVMELKACDLDDYIDIDSLVAQVPPQNKYNAAVAYGALIATGTSKATEDSIRFAAIVGLNAWLSYEQQGHPLTWNNYETERWAIIRKIFKEAMAINTLALAIAISEYKEIERKNNRQHS